MPLKSYLCNCGSLRYNWMLHLKIKFLLCMLQLDFFFFIEKSNNHFQGQYGTNNILAFRKTVETQCFNKGISNDMVTVN